ncbi:MAG: DUF4402 domain-containing protein [Prolixibacteraceae bacterium]
MKKLIILFIAVAGFGVSSYAQSSVINTTATSTARIIAPIGVEKITNMDFGTIVQNLTGGTVRLNALTTATRTASPTTLITSINAGVPTAASFTITGETNATYTVVLPADVLLQGPLTNTMHMTDMKVANYLDADFTTGTNSISATGANNVIYVGGLLTLGATQATGQYTSAAFAITVAYN